MHNGGSNGAGGSSKAGKGGNIEKMYQKKSQLEHILLRPDTYIGSVERVTDNMWVCEKKEVEGIEGSDPTYRMVQREISYVPGLYKIFDEILVNAAGKSRNCSIHIPHPMLMIHHSLLFRQQAT